MALIQCPDCGRQVSDGAPSCPGCGRPIATQGPQVALTTQGKTGKFLDPLSNARSCLGCLAVLMLLVGLAAIRACMVAAH